MYSNSVPGSVVFWLKSVPTQDNLGECRSGAKQSIGGVVVALLSLQGSGEATEERLVLMLKRGDTTSV